MSTTPSTSAEQSTQSSGSEKTPDSGRPRAKRVYTKSCISPTLRAFMSFSESLGQFKNHIETKIDLIGIDPVDLLQTELERLDNKCERIQKKFDRFISELDMAIENYERKKLTDLAADANSVIAPKKQTANCSSLPKIKDTNENFTALNNSLCKIHVVIRDKIIKSRYEDYSLSVEKKLNNLKNMCEYNSKSMEELGKKIKHAIDENKEIR